jgi:hypothetical protein
MMELEANISASQEMRSRDKCTGSDAGLHRIDQQDERYRDYCSGYASG